MHGADTKRITIHPLFLAVGILSACTGGFLLFLSAVLAALEHECAHAFAARRYGFTLDKIVLMPYGAVIKGDLKGIGRREELAVLLAGPLANGATALLFVALWWLYPETYPYTDTAAYISFSLFFVNLLPAYPLDGGRILRVLLLPFGERRAMAVCRAVSVLTAAGIAGFFVWSCFSVPQWTALAFSVLLLCGSFGGGGYKFLEFSRKRSFLRGVEERRIAVDADLPFRSVIRHLREDKYLTLLLFEDGEFLAELSEEEVLSALGRGAYAEPLKSALQT